MFRSAATNATVLCVHAGHAPTLTRFGPRCVAMWSGVALSLQNVQEVVPQSNSLPSRRPFGLRMVRKAPLLVSQGKPRLSSVGASTDAYDLLVCTDHPLFEHGTCRRLGLGMRVADMGVSQRSPSRPRRLASQRV